MRVFYSVEKPAYFQHFVYPSLNLLSKLSHCEICYNISRLGCRLQEFNLLYPARYTYSRPPWSFVSSGSIRVYTQSVLNSQISGRRFRLPPVPLLG